MTYCWYDAGSSTWLLLRTLFWSLLDIFNFMAFEWLLPKLILATIRFKVGGLGFRSSGVRLQGSGPQARGPGAVGAEWSGLLTTWHADTVGMADQPLASHGASISSDLNVAQPYSRFLVPRNHLGYSFRSQRPQMLAIWTLWVRCHSHHMLEAQAGAASRQSCLRAARCTTPPL